MTDQYSQSTNQSSWHPSAIDRIDESHSQKPLERWAWQGHCLQVGAECCAALEIDMRRLAKTGSYWVVHITVAVTVAWALTGNLAAAMAIGLLEPTVQAFVFYIHEWLWERKAASPALVAEERPA
jgi:uncharacterized membrane protein